MAPSGGGSDAYFFEVHKDGVFNFVSLSYENGYVFHWRLSKEKKMDYASMCSYLKETTDKPFYALFLCLPECTLEVGLKIIEGDCDVASMYQFVDAYGTISMYMAHISQNLAEYYSKNICFDESGDQATSRHHEVMKKDASNMSYLELLSWAKEEAGLLKKTIDKGKSKVLVDDIPVNKHVHRNNGIVIEENVNPSAMVTDRNSESEHEHEFNYSLYIDSESNYSDKSNDYLSEGENELIDLRKRKTEAKKAPKTSNRQTFPVNKGTSTRNSRYKRVYGVGDSETVMDHEDFMDDLMRKLRDEGNGMTDPFKIMESKVEKYSIHDVETHWRMQKPKVGEKFVDVDQLKECLTYYALANGFSLWFYRSEKISLIAKCGSRPEKLKEPKKGKQSKWKRYPSTSEGKGSNCPWRCYSKEMTEEKSFQVISMIDEHTCARDFKYGNLVNYKWIGLKEGWKLGCRNVIALDGCFLKKPNVGEILNAIGRDKNNHIFPVAWAVVNVENKDNWSWFPDLLEDDLDMPTGNGLTLISDQHKGLIQAVKDVMPHAEHKQCAQHIYEGFRKQFSGVEFRSLFWAASKARYPGLFNKIIDKVKRDNPTIENGFSECFNLVLLRVRNKPLITMLEAMRVIVLERMNTMRKLLESWSEYICPNIQKRLEVTKDQHRFWHVITTGGNLFEVRNGSEAFIVDEKHRTCTCRLWQLSGRMDFWPDISEMSRVLPPKPRKMSGRPRKKRIYSRGSTDGRSKRVKTTVTRGGIGNRGRLAPFVTFSRLGTWFNVGQGIMESDRNAKTRATQSSQAPDIVPHVVVLDITAIPMINFVSPRPRSERIIKKKLAKNRIGSLNSNALDSEY
ncbi:pentatricopeptide repeat-containing protein, partial [Tanacetum coccineum]